MTTPDELQDEGITEHIRVSPLQEILLDLYQMNNAYLCEEHLKIMDSNAFVEKLTELDAGIIRILFRGIQVGGENTDITMIYVILHGNVSDTNAMSSSERIDPEKIQDAAQENEGSKMVIVRDIRAATDVAKSRPGQFDGLKRWDLWIVNLTAGDTRHKVLLAKLMFNRVFARAGMNRETSTRSVKGLIEHIKTNVLTS